MNEQAVNIHEELIHRCRAGDQEAHFRLYKLYSKAMYNVGYRITCNEADAEDVLQEAFISAFRNLDSYRGDASFGSWIKKIVINKAINVLKKRKLESMPDGDEFDIPAEEAEQEYLPELGIEKVISISSDAPTVEESIKNASSLIQEKIRIALANP